MRTAANNTVRKNDTAYDAISPNNYGIIASHIPSLVKLADGFLFLTYLLIFHRVCWTIKIWNLIEFRVII